MSLALSATSSMSRLLAPAPKCLLSEAEATRVLRRRLATDATKLAQPPALSEYALMLKIDAVDPRAGMTKDRVQTTAFLSGDKVYVQRTTLARQLGETPTAIGPKVEWFELNGGTGLKREFFAYGFAQQPVYVAGAALNKLLSGLAPSFTASAPKPEDVHYTLHLGKGVMADVLHAKPGALPRVVFSREAGPVARTYAAPVQLSRSMLPGKTSWAAVAQAMGR